MNKIFFLVFLSLASFSIAGTDIFKFNSKQDEQRYRQLIDNIRCPVCQGQSIGGSNSSLAKDLRAKTKEMIENNKTNSQIKDFMVERYGDFVSFTPPMKSTTYILWFAPFLFLFITIVLFFRKENVQVEDIDISKAQELLKK